MEKVTNPNVKVLALGSNLVAKQMQASAGDLLPRHLANMESILLIQEGECILMIKGKDEYLKQGDAFVVPPDIEHQIKAETNFKAVHFMPKEIKFQFFK
ncbi:MAG: AraC family ligand binding domain-containing protein [Psychroflexus sp.]|nr:AraC family ligand binding domain-containing protein [Psychroflexus sp.]MDN6309430.1 AraC family ligand binding domain-containing protein [Psychroflexus sp.]